GIRDLYVTGVQTCALPIFGRLAVRPVGHIVHHPAAANITSTFNPRVPRRVVDNMANRADSKAANREGRVKVRERKAKLPQLRLRSEERRVGKEWTAKLS